VSAEHVVTVGVDGSSGSWAALLWAADHALRTGRALAVVHVRTPAGATGSPAQEVFDRELLDDAADSVARDFSALSTTSRLLAGDPGDVLVRLSSSSDLLVIGRGPRGMAVLLRGSVAEPVLRRAMCPVVVLSGASRTPAGPVVVGAFGDDGDDAAFRFALEEAARRGDELLVVSRPGQDKQPAPAFPTVPVRTVITTEPPERALAREARGSGLLVVGCRREGSAPLPRLGPLARWAVHQFDGPVAVVGHGRLRTYEEPIHHAASVGVANRIPDAF
jgi:nucleotide-binding universal stress UspA family protein